MGNYSKFVQDLFASLYLPRVLQQATHNIIFSISIYMNKISKYEKNK